MIRKMQNNVEFVVRDNLCTGCGTCAGVCPSSSITMQERKGLNIPVVDKKSCRVKNRCKICSLVCPGQGINLYEISDMLFPGTQNDFYLGRFLECYTGYSANHDIRFHSASGGVITQMLLFMLEKKLIDGAVVTKMNQQDPLKPEVVIARTRGEIISARSSKYCPVNLNILIKSIRKENIKVAVVGLPCHIHGFRKAEMVFPDLRKKVVAYLGLFCSSTRSYYATRYLIREYGIKKDDIRTFAYRDEGWLGSMLVKLKTNEIRKIPFRKYYREIRSFFIPHRCTLCSDHAAELSDISFGDIYIPEFWDDKIGTNSVIARSEKGHSLLRELARANVVTLEKINKRCIIRAQQNMLTRKKKHVQTRIFFLKLFFKKTPNFAFDPILKINLLERLKYLVTAVILYSQIRIGRNKKMWFLIRYLNAIAKIVSGRLQ